MKMIIIGAGPGGYETALLAARRGVEVILIESGPVGGTCLNEGCIPTKAFCRNAEVLDGLHEAESFGVTGLSFDFDFRAVVSRKNAVVEQLRGGVEGLLGHKNITLVRGKAYFKDDHTILVDGQEYMADYIIIATGSVSATLPVPGAELPGILTSKEILDIQEVPGRLCVIGGGVIGLEFASIFRSFGSVVTVLEYCKDILPRFDTDLAKRLKQSLGKRGIEINTQSQVTAINENNGVYEVAYTRKGKEETVVADKVLMAVGRRANLDSLNLADIGIQCTRRGVAVNEVMQTNIPHIYAIGGINGLMMLAHAATFQGIVALDHIMGYQDEIDLSVMPAAVFTSPEAASVGLTEDECKENGIPVKCLKSFFRANGKAVTMGETDGFCKIVVAAEPKEGADTPYEPGRILGCHMYGPHSSDIIQEVCALISRKATLAEFKDIIHTHPTLTEVLQNAVHS
jgi:dihydrolipoamide dehydrogenase